MSMHMVACCKSLDLSGGAKLAMIAFADSADDDTRIAFPGLESIQEWASVGRSRATELVGELCDAGLLKKHRAGHRGRRAEYIVFPNGCCAAHPPITAAPTSPEGAGGSAPLTLIGATHPAPNTAGEKGADSPASMSVNGADSPAPISAGPNGADSPAPSGAKVPERGRSTGPLLLLSTSPLPPASGGTATTACQKPGPTPHTNCRDCGTTGRQIKAAQKRQRDEAKRLADRQALAANREAREQAAATRTPQTDQLVDQVRANIARSSR